ncbi:LuxR C-terminal-related transcriptional regulator [Geodermatophilus sp. CPCC 206100]|uniref:LuxR C-terminal-related transcriptional regulator n=1 Tax=Geodermatophilus sp. CPCC 206100 TaxID=3020054 RepID=UPI003AFFF9B1
MLAGRADELALIGRVLDDARRSAGCSLVLRGGAGMGKSVLLDAARRQADDMTVLLAQGVESESELPFAGLHQLLRGTLQHLPRIPSPQADHLRAALGLARGGAVDRFLISAAVLSLLAEVAETRPLLCLVDDAHWLDVASADALVFAARRLHAEAVAVVFAARDSGGRRFAATGLPERRLRGLDPAAAAQVLGAPRGADVPPDIAVRLTEATGGNPFALVELRSALAARQLTGADPLPVPLPLTDGLVSVALDQVRRLPDSTRTLLLVAAADDTGSAGTVLRAAAELGIDPEAMAPAEALDLVTVAGDDLAFRHPLVRSAIVAAATSPERRAAHRALATALADDADRCAWHRASAAVTPDADAVAGLVAAAARARQRGGHDAASAASERAAQLSSAAEATPHLVQAAVDAWLAGQTDRARDLASRARSRATGPLRRELDRLTGMIEFRCGRPAEAFGLLVRAAEEAGSDSQAVHLLAEASEAASIAGNFAGCGQAAAIADGLGRPGRVDDAVIRDFVIGMGAFLTGDRERAVPLLRQAVTASHRLSEVVPIAQAGRAAWYLGDEAGAQVLFERAVQLARERGQLGLLPYTLNRVAAGEVVAGRWASATSYYEEALELARSTGQDELVGHLLGGLALLAAFRGDERGLASLEEEFRRVAEPRGLLLPQEQVAWAVGHLHLSAGRTAEALAAFRPIVHPAVLASSLVDRVDAAVRAGEVALARSWLVSALPEAGTTDAGHLPAGPAHACALLHEEPEAGLRHACRPETPGRPFDRARAALALGEILRRNGRRLDARTALGWAVHGLEQLGAELWAERARRELRAAGRSIRADRPGPNAALTPQELQVARYAAQGRSTRDVAALLCLSPRTIDFHLRNVFAKLGVASRTELAHLPLDRLAGPRAESRPRRAG